MQRDRLAIREIAVANVLSGLLPVLDAIDRAREHGEVTGGLKAVADVLENHLAGLGLETVGMPGEPFDPTRHEAVTHELSDTVQQPTCATVLRRGYRSAINSCAPLRFRSPNRLTGKPVSSRRLTRRKYQAVMGFSHLAHSMAATPWRRSRSAKPPCRTSSMWSYIPDQSPMTMELFQRATSSVSSQTGSGLTRCIRRRLSRLGSGRPGQHGAHQGRGEKAAAGQAQHRVQRRPARTGDGYGVGGQPLAGGLRVGAGKMLEEHRCRPRTVGRTVGQQQMRSVLLKDREPCRGGAGTEEERGGPRVRPPGQLQRLLWTGDFEGGEFQDPGGAAGQRHQQLPGRREDLGVQAGGTALLGRGSVQRARRLPVHLAPHAQGLLLRGAELHPHQPLGDPRRPAPVEAARPDQLSAQDPGRRPHPFPPRRARAAVRGRLSHQNTRARSGGSR
uniref:nucleotide exchange factor GrpE n=1 Tax=Streptomyces atratus TaxID=1893 RepID=UPI003B21FCB4